MIVVSCFDGMSCGMIAAERVGLDVTEYHAFEIDKHAIQVSNRNYPNIIHHGDINQWKKANIDWHKVDLLIGGSPCQGFSFAGKQLAFNDPRSALFFKFVEILKYIRLFNPNVKFLLENVKMKKEHLDVISETLGVEPVFINSSLVSAQNRQRYYWCNWHVPQPENKGIMLADILEDDDLYIKTDKKFMPKKTQDKASCLTGGAHSGGNHSDMDILLRSAAIVGRKINENGVRDDYSDLPTIQTLEVSDSGKSRCLSTVSKDTLVSWLKAGRYQDFTTDDYRRLTTIECERLQTVPDNYTNHVSNTQRYKMLGNGWTVDVITHIFKEMIKQ